MIRYIILYYIRLEEIIKNDNHIIYLINIQKYF